MKCVQGKAASIGRSADAAFEACVTITCLNPMFPNLIVKLTYIGARPDYVVNIVT